MGPPCSGRCRCPVGRQCLAEAGIAASVGSYDNAWAESFNATLKNERVHRTTYPTRARAIADITKYIELRYNHKRLHSALGYRTPDEAKTSGTPHNPQHETHTTSGPKSFPQSNVSNGWKMYTRRGQRKGTYTWDLAWVKD